MLVCLTIPTTLDARCRAIAHLIRPHDVLAHAHAALTHAPWYHPNEVEAIASYLQQLGLTYLPDRKGSDSWCTPLATLQRRGGDCDDHSILAASMLRAAGARADVILGWLRRPGRRGYHAWVAGTARCGRCRFVLEPQNGKLWWHDTPDDRDAEYRIAPERCSRVDRHLRHLA
jgi:hypothetical protein